MHALCYCLNTLNVTEDSALVADLCLIAYSHVFPVLLSLAVVTNVLNAVVLLSPHPGSRFQPTPIRKYLLWITLSHCVICATVLLGIWVRDRVGLSYSWAFYFAHFEQPLYDVFNCSYAWIIVGLSRDRHQAVCRPHQYTVAASHERAAWRIALAYAFSVVVYAPHCFAQEPVFSAEHAGWHVTGTDLFSSRAWAAWAVLSQALHRLVPAAILVGLNTKILVAVSRLGNSSVRPGGRPGSSPSRRRERQITNLLLALTLSFLVTNVPAAAIKLVYIAMGQHCQIHAGMEIARSIANCLEMAGYSADFLLYFLMNPEYRRDLHGLLSKLWSFFGVSKTCPLPEVTEEQATISQ
ncbi:uncharacterized protein LOC119590659 [Penaeus monodon]|uniref:uncharacterized protein LOC119590659 n=1 Tax=Penaeus monodon TaxID=6687 RepID=UPI0018A7DD60|nr:uncharacterized protein LOC119590659 [Penaeus monodon]